MALMRGFKTHAAWLAGRIRERLGIAELAPLDVFALANMYGIDVVPFSHDGCPPAAVQHFTTKGNGQVSGFALPVDDGHLIAYNDAQVIERIRSTMTHEVGHVVLQHEAAIRVASEKGCIDTSDLDQEAEATELGGELLIPLQVARKAAIDDRPATDLASQFQTSIELARWRMNISGGVQIRQKLKAGRSSPS